MPDGERGLSESYRGAFEGTLPPPTRPALLVVDVVMAYLEPASPLYAGVETALASCERIIEAARNVGFPVIFTKVEYSKGGTDGGIFYRKVPALQAFDRGSSLGAFPHTIEPKPGELVITKTYASAFFGTALASTLTSQGIDGVFICGFSTSGCVRATAIDACQHGFLPYVVREACGDRHPAPHDQSLFDIQAKYGEVVSEFAALKLFGVDPA